MTGGAKSFFYFDNLLSEVFLKTPHVLEISTSCTMRGHFVFARADLHFPHWSLSGFKLNTFFFDHGSIFNTVFSLLLLLLVGLLNAVQTVQETCCVDDARLTFQTPCV